MAGLSFLTCRSCRDSSVAHVPTHHTVETRGIEPLTLALQRQPAPLVRAAIGI